MATLYNFRAGVVEDIDRVIQKQTAGATRKSFQVEIQCYQSYQVG